MSCISLYSLKIVVNILFAVKGVFNEGLEKLFYTMLLFEIHLNYIIDENENYELGH